MPMATRSAAFSATTRWTALGTTVELAVSEPAGLQDAERLARDLIDQVDRTCSRFRADSDLVRANTAAGRWVEVDAMLVGAVRAAVRAAELTGGLVDPTLGRAMAAIGYDRDLAAVRSGTVDPAAVRLAPAPPEPGAWRRIGIDDGGAVLVPERTALDLGATGKAFAADLVTARVAGELGCGVVAGIGGDVAVAGFPPHTASGPGWPVEVGDEADGPGQVVLLDAGGLATSSTRRRSWRHRGRLVHHLLDPVTGRPVPLVWSEVTVRAGTCLEANAAATAAMVLGEPAVYWLERAGLPALLRRGDGGTVRAAGWPVSAF